jgi:hypothetical protein
MENSRFKFRAWIKDEKTWHYFTAFEGIGATYPSYPGQAIYESNLEIMQFTGLHDKNGIELFESDIVRYLGWLWEIKWGENTTAFYLFSIEKDLRPDSYFGSAVSQNCERIGNIYERQS